MSHRERSDPQHNALYGPRTTQFRCHSRGYANGYQKEDMKTTTTTPEIPDNRTEDTPQRARWREAQRRYYERNRERKLAAILRYREEHPDRYAQAHNMARKRSRRGIQRNYRKASADA